ncbi:MULTISPECIES: MFS transporter [Paenibacillus]|uniref:Transporter YwbF n=1 Tax=Paenibacillus cineris TaxID=237530 RepID=A0ABQ4LAX4_9BACL|nr:MULTISPECIES: MFS transporter [Paenibacillus]MCM2997668.1 MFS transporter [Paenibacillus cellulositrophicus]GIO53462.1 putative transporter YwbF [Paenibacillus cineris]
MRTSAPVKAFNFLFFALLAIFIPFLPVYFDEQGLSPSQIGFIVGTGGFITIVAQPLWGMISDRTKTIRKVLLLLLVCAIMTGFVLYHTGTYSLIILFAMLTYFFLMPVDPLTESLNFRVAESAGISYGSLRTYGALGYAVMSLFAGYIMTSFGAHSLAYLFAAIGLVSFVITLFMPDAPVSGKPVTLSSLKHFLSSRETLLFLILVFISSIPARMNDTYLGVYIKELGGKASLVGQAWFLAAGSEIVVFALSFWWLRKGSELMLIAFSGFFYFIRFFASAWIEDPHLLAYLQLLQLLTFPVFYSAAIQYLYRIVPVEWRATGQTVLALLFFGVSGIIASFAGGALYEAFGGRTLFLTISGMSLAGTLFGIVLYRIYGRRNRAATAETAGENAPE